MDQKLRSDPADKDLRIFDKTRINLGDFIGEESYGKVFKANVGKLKRSVVVKILRSQMKSEEIHENCIKTLTIISTFKHWNIVDFIGVAAEKNDECMQMVWAYVDGGTLLDFAKMKIGKKQIANKLFLDAIKGMEYLHSMGLIHKNLSARNILLDHYPNAKIADYVTECTYLDGQGGNYYKFDDEGDYPSLQIRWSPQELIPYDVKRSLGFSSDFETFLGGFSADVWSFAVVIFEVLTFGEVPYGIATSNIDVIKAILQGYNPLTYTQKKYKIPQDYVGLMQKIFIPDPDKRPKFDEIRKISHGINAKDGFYKPENYQGQSETDMNPNQNQRNSDGKNQLTLTGSQRLTRNQQKQQQQQQQQKQQQQQQQRSQSQQRSSRKKKAQNCAPPSYAETIQQQPGLMGQYANLPGFSQQQMPMPQQQFFPQQQPQVVIQTNPRTQMRNFEQENKIRELEEAVQRLEMEKNQPRISRPPYRRAQNSRKNRNRDQNEGGCGQS